MQGSPIRPYARWRAPLAAWLAENHRNRVLRSIDQLALLLHRAISNHSYDLTRNGEAWLIGQLPELTHGVAFDVGANEGTWSQLVKRRYPDCELHCFEPTPAAYTRLNALLGAYDKVTVNQVALADREAVAAMRYFPGRSVLSTFVDYDHGQDYEIIEVPTQQGDRYAAAHQIERITLLKVDAEGSEPEVLDGFEPMFASNAVDIVQFEYGRGSIVTKHLLKDYYAFFNERGYEVGKLFPNGVEFCRYSYDLEDFLGPNYVAVRRSKTEILERLR